MKTVLTSIITSIITVVVALFVVQAITGHGHMFSDDDHEKECIEHIKKECEKKCSSKEDAHHMMMERLAPAREKFETMLTEDEKATITAVREKFADVDHEKMCEEGKEKFQEQHKEDFDALLAIAGNHKEFLDEVHNKMHMTTKGHDGEVEKHACPEALKCKEATEKCKGEHKKVEGEQKDPEAEKKCKEAEAECKAECEKNFKIHFILMKEHCDHDHDHDHEHEHDEQGDQEHEEGDDD